MVFFTISVANWIWIEIEIHVIQDRKFNLLRDTCLFKIGKPENGEKSEILKKVKCWDKIDNWDKIEDWDKIENWDKIGNWDKIENWDKVENWDKIENMAKNFW